MKEKWKEVSGFDGLYFVSNDGQIKSAKTGMIRKLTPDRDGYLTELGRSRPSSIGG